MSLKTRLIRKLKVYLFFDKLKNEIENFNSWISFLQVLNLKIEKLNFEVRF